MRKIGKLKREVEKAKRTLSSQQSMKLKTFEDGNDFSETLTPAKFEELHVDLFRTTMQPVEQANETKGMKYVVRLLMMFRIGRHCPEDCPRHRPASFLSMSSLSSLVSKLLVTFSQS